MELSNLSIVLASKSPRRREILTALGVPFTVVVADADESSRATDPAALVEELALRKGCAVRELLREEGRFESTLVIAADTVVSIDGEILGKPKDVADAERMLRLLSGRAHQVSSGIALLSGDRAVTAHETTEVRFAPLSDGDIARYLSSGESMDKAGAYGVQGLASVYIEGLCGDYFNVVGLPVHRLECTLRDFLGVGLSELAQKAEA